MKKGMSVREFLIRVAIMLFGPLVLIVGIPYLIGALLH